MDYAHCRPSKGLVEHPRRGFNIWIISMLTATLGVNFAESADPETVHRRHFVMGTWLDLRIEAPTRSGALAASESVLRTVEDAERRLSTWRDDSELTGLNQFRTGEWAELSASLARDLAEAARWERRSDGAFRPGIAMLVEMWDLRGQGRVPSPDELRIGVSASLPDGIEIVGRRTRRIRSDYRIEEGGFGKGAALVDTIEAVRFAAASCAVMDFGGQVFLWGECQPVSIAVADPRDRQVPVAEIKLAEGTAASSGNSLRGILVDGERLGHILDPRTGVPVVDWGSVTVISSDPMTADCISTALYVMGPRVGAEWILRYPDIQAVFVERRAGDLRISATSGLVDRLQALGGRSVDWLRTADGVDPERSESFEQSN